MECNKCHCMNNAAGEFCSFCGRAVKPIKSTCHFCQAEIEQDSVFCKYCGKARSDDESINIQVEDFCISTSKNQNNNRNLISSESTLKKKRIRKILPGNISSPLHKKSSLLLPDSDIFSSIKLKEHLNRDEVQACFNNNLCIDIGRSSIKLFKAELDSDNYISPSFSSVMKTPFDAFKKEIFYYSDSVAGPLKSYLERNNLNHNKISLTVPSSQSFILTFEVPFMDKTKLPGLIKERLKLISFPYKKAHINAYVVEKPACDEEIILQVRVFAVNKDTMNNISLLPSLLGVKLCNIIYTHNAVFNALNLVEEEMDKIAVIEMSPYVTNITTIKNNLVWQTGVLNRGLSNIVKSISFSRKISEEKSHTLLMKSPLDITNLDLPKGDFLNTMIHTLKEWITDISKIFSSFGSDLKLSRKNYKYLILCGEGLRIKNLNNFTGNQLGIKCYNFNLPSSKNISDENFSIFMPCLGLSVSDFFKDEEDGEKITLKTGFWSSIFGD